MSGVQEVQPIRHQTALPGLFHHGVERGLKALGPEAGPEAAPDGTVERGLLGAQTQEPFVQ